MSLFHSLPDLKYTRLKKREAKNAQRILHIVSPPPLLPPKSYEFINSLGTSMKFS